MGKLGFQELSQLPMFSPITKYQVHVENSTRISELTSAAFNRAQEESGPTQLNYSRNILNSVHEYRIAGPTPRTKIVPSPDTVKQIVDALLQSKKPVLLAGGGLHEASGLQRLAARLDSPVATTYLHNDCFPKSDPRAVGSLGYMGSQAAMRCIQDSDLVVAIGSRLNPFGTTPQYGIPYWDAQKPLIQIDKNRAALGVSCNPTIPVHGDAVATVDAINAELDQRGISDTSATASLIPYAKYRDEWHVERTPNIPIGEDGRIAPKMVLETLRKVLADLKDPIVTTDIGHCCSQSLAYLEFEVPRSLFTAGTFGSCGTSIPMAVGARFADPNRPVFALVGDGAANMQGINELLTCKRNGLGITILVFRNEIWGAELLNQLIWTDARTVGTEIENPPFAGIAEAYGATGVTVKGSIEDLESELKAAAIRQSKGETTLIEVMCTPNMGAPFRSDAMSCPTRHLDKYKHLTTNHADYERQFEYSKKQVQ